MKLAYVQYVEQKWSLFICLVILAYLDSQENVCSQISVSTYDEGKQKKYTYVYMIYTLIRALSLMQHIQYIENFAKIKKY